MIYFTNLNVFLSSLSLQRIKVSNQQMTYIHRSVTHHIPVVVSAGRAQNIDRTKLQKMLNQY